MFDAYWLAVEEAAAGRGEDKKKEETFSQRRERTRAARIRRVGRRR